MKKLFYFLILLIFNFCLCCCKTEKPKTHKESSEKSEKAQKTEDYKVYLDKLFYKQIQLGNYTHILKITPNLSKPRNNMEYTLLLIRDKKMRGEDYEKLNDTLINLLINKKTITDLYKKNNKDSINLDNFHLLATRHTYSRASEIHFEMPMYSIKDSVFCNATYHFDYNTGIYRFYISTIEQTKKEAFEKYNNL